MGIKEDEPLGNIEVKCELFQLKLADEKNKKRLILLFL